MSSAGSALPSPDKEGSDSPQPDLPLLQEIGSIVEIPVIYTDALVINRCHIFNMIYDLRKYSNYVARIIDVYRMIKKIITIYILNLKARFQHNNITVAKKKQFR